MTTRQQPQALVVSNYSNETAGETAGLGLAPIWDAPQRVSAFMTHRLGGVSRPPFDSLNLGDHVGDKPDAYNANRMAVAQHLALTPCFMQQVHGTQVHLLTAQTAGNAVQADAVVCTTPGLAATVMVADCLPVLLAHKHLPIVAAAHAGWRGLANGVLQASLQAMAEQADCSLQALCADTTVWLGPCIGPNAFEVGQEVYDAFAGQSQAFGDVAHWFVPQARMAKQSGQKYKANLAGLASQLLSRMGVANVAGNDGSASWCTVNNPQRYFSHRRDHASLGSSGRMAAFIGLKPC